MALPGAVDAQRARFAGEQARGGDGSIQQDPPNDDNDAHSDLAHAAAVLGAMAAIFTLPALRPVMVAVPSPLSRMVA